MPLSIMLLPSCPALIEFVKKKSTARGGSDRSPQPTSPVSTCDHRLPHGRCPMFGCMQRVPHHVHACVCGDVGRVSGQGTIIGSGSAALPHTINLSFEAIAALISALSASATNPCSNVWLFLPSRVHTHASGYAVCASSWLDLGPPSLCGPRVCMGVRACLQACTHKQARMCANVCIHVCMHACARGSVPARGSMWASSLWYTVGTWNIAVACGMCPHGGLYIYVPHMCVCRREDACAHVLPHSCCAITHA